MWSLGTEPDLAVVLIQVHHRVTWELVHYAVELKHHDSVVARIDTSHQEVHRHQFYRNPGRQQARVVIREIRSQQDVEDTFASSVDEIVENAEQYYGRWKYGN